MAGSETLLLYLFIIVAGAKIGGAAARRLGQPPVVGEIIVGILLGPSLLRILPSFSVLDAFHAYTAGDAGPVPSPTDLATAGNLEVLAVFAELGVLLLLFEVGLESDFAQFRKVGASAALVGTFGVVFSLAIGWGLSELFARRIDWAITDAALAQPHLLHAFIGATLAATSVGITARVLADLQKLRTPESQIILGAAVFDDVLGLIVLAIVGGLVTAPDAVTPVRIAIVFLLALGFLAAALTIGRWLGPRLLELTYRAIGGDYVQVGFGFAFMLLVSYLAALAGLAPIVGAFAAGLCLSASRQRHILFEHIRPVGSLFIGFFFVTLGARVDLTLVPSGLWPTVLVIALALTVAGTFAKLLAGLGVVGVKASRYVVGVGMVPRGEVGLIFAVFGLEHGLLENWQYTAILLVVLATTIVTPFWLRGLAGRFQAPTEPVAAPISRTAEGPLP